MKTINKNLVLGLALLSVNAVAHESAWDVTLARGWVRFDPDFQLHTDDVDYLGVAYNWKNDWAFEAEATKAKAEPKNSAETAAEDGFALKTRYNLWDQHDVAAAYLMAGVVKGKVNYEFTDDYNATGITVGAGVFYPLTDWLRLRAEASQHFYNKDSVKDFQVFLGVNFIWGGRHTERTMPVATTTLAISNTSLPTMNAVGFTQAAVIEKPKDSDGDGVFDALDKCPATPAGIIVNADGCGGLSEKVSIKLDIRFDAGKADIKANFAPELAKVADFLRKYPNAKAVIEGHTDSSGNEERNQILSQRRANSVMAAIVKDFGIAADRVSAVGYGADRPIADNKSKEGRAQNRRVTAEIEEKVTIQK